MKVNYSNFDVIKGKKGIFLAGPTPRSNDVISWRGEAVNILERIGFDGVIFVPELEHDDRTFDYVNQTEWEREALYEATTIIFWVPRSEVMPAYTTNVEFGYWMAKNSDKCLYGRPDNAQKIKYLDWLYKVETGKSPYNNLEDLLKEAVKVSNEKYELLKK